MNCHFTMREGFGCLTVSRSYVVWGSLPLVGSPKENGSLVKGQKKDGPKRVL